MHAVSGVPALILISTVLPHCCWTAVSPVANTAKLCNTAGKGEKVPECSVKATLQEKGDFIRSLSLLLVTIL